MNNYLTVQQYLLNELSFCDLVELNNIFDRIYRKELDSNNVLLQMFYSKAQEAFGLSLTRKEFEKAVVKELLRRALDRLDSINTLSSL